MMSGDGTNQPRGSWLSRLWSSERGQGIVEYALIITLVGLGVKVLALGFHERQDPGALLQVGQRARPGGERHGVPAAERLLGDIVVPGPCIGNWPDVTYTYYQANTVYGPGTASQPLGYEGIYVSQADAVVLGLATFACGLSGVNFPPTHFVVANGYTFDCTWSFATWHVPGNNALVLGGRCAVVPSRPANGSVVLAPDSRSGGSGADRDAVVVEQPRRHRLHVAADRAVGDMGRRLRQRIGMVDVLDDEQLDVAE